MERSALLVDLYELTMSQCYFNARRGRAATFDLFVRALPPGRSFLVAAGLADALEYARSLRFTAGDISYLRSLKLFSRPFLEYLGVLRFTGDIWAMAEGSVFFPGEPILRVTADIIQAQIVESFFLNTVNVQTMIASKAARVVLAAAGRPVYDFSLRRTHGSDAGIKAARSSYIAGCAGTSNVLAGQRYGIPVAGTMAHSFVMSFPTEREAFAAYCDAYPGKSILLVDTYDTVRGVRDAISVGLALRRRGRGLTGIRLDSGDIVKLSRIARRMLDGAGLKSALILASGNLDEFEISRIVAAKAPVDSFGVGTRMGASVDAPSLDCIYKLSEISDARGAFLPAMKLSQGKLTYPGRKQVRRVTGRDGIIRRDSIGLENERTPGVPLLAKVMEKGKLVRQEPALAKIREFAAASVRSLPPSVRAVNGRGRFKPEISAGLNRLTVNMREQLSGRQPLPAQKSLL